MRDIQKLGQGQSLDSINLSAASGHSGASDLQRENAVRSKVPDVAVEYVAAKILETKEAKDFRIIKFHVSGLAEPTTLKMPRESQKEGWALWFDVKKGDTILVPFSADPKTGAPQLNMKDIRRLEKSDEKESKSKSTLI